MRKKEDFVLPRYYTILPAEIRFNKDLSPSARILYGDICLLASKNGFCDASNEYLAFLYSVDDKTVSAWVSQLERFQTIRVVQLKGFKRKIYPKIAHLQVKDSQSSSQETVNTQSGKTESKSSGKADNNNTSINNINTTETNPEEFSSEDYFKSLVTHKDRKLQIIAIFALKKKKYLEFKDKKSANAFVYSGRNLSAAKKLTGFTDKQILDGMRKASEITINGREINWGLETVEKQITK